MTTLYQYPKCSTCRRALSWLKAHRVPAELHDLVAQPIALETLRQLHQRSGLPLSRFFNTSGESYRSGNFKERLKSMTPEQALKALASDGKLVKRPILDLGSAVLVGFDEDEYKRATP